MWEPTKTILYLALVLSTTAVAKSQTTAGTTTSHQAPVHSTTKNVAGKTRATRYLIYTNNRYGFRFYLPKSWKGYSVIENQWAGTNEAGETGEEHGPVITLRHPLWTEENPRQDIDIVILTRKQGREDEQTDLSVGAAPYPPSIIGRNKKFVFALFPRWEMEGLDGCDEVLGIMGHNPLHPF